MDDPRAALVQTSAGPGHSLDPVDIVRLLFRAHQAARPLRPGLPGHTAMMTAYLLLYTARWLTGAAARRAESAMMVAASAVIVGLAAYFLFFSDMTIKRNGTHWNTTNIHYGNNLDDFVQKVKPRVSNDVVLFLDGQQMPLETLLGRHQGGTATLDQQRAAQWCIKFYEPGSAAEIVSQPIPQIDGEFPGQLGLYRLQPGAGIAQFQTGTTKFPPQKRMMHPEDLPAGQHEKWVQVWRASITPTHRRQLRQKPK